MNIDIIPEIDPTKINVLVVDDIPLNVMLIEKMLKKFNFNIIKAYNGPEALEKLAANDVHLVLLDIMMPDLDDGYKVLEKLRKEEETKALPVVLVSALNSPMDITKGKELGANDFITKPIVMERLQNCVATQINSMMEAV